MRLSYRKLLVLSLIALLVSSCSSPDRYLQPKDVFIPLSMYFQERFTYLNCIGDHPKFRFINAKLVEPEEAVIKFKATAVIDEKEQTIVGDLKVISHARTYRYAPKHISLQVFLNDWHFTSENEDTEDYCGATNWFQSSNGKPKKFIFTKNNREFTHSRLSDELIIMDELCKVGEQTHCQYLAEYLDAKPSRKRNAVWRDEMQRKEAMQRHEDAKRQLELRFNQRVSDYER